MKIYNILFLFLGCTFSYAQTEKNVVHQSLLCTRYYNHLTINNKWSVQSEFDNRIFIKPVKENLYELRVQGRFKINDNLDVGAGFAHFSVATQDPEITYDFNVPEYRGQQTSYGNKILAKLH